MENSSLSRTEVCKPTALRVRSRNSPSTNVRQYPVAFDFAGEHPSSSCEQTQGSFLAHGQAYSYHAGNDSGSSRVLGLHRGQSCPQNQIAATRASTGEDGAVPGAAVFASPGVTGA